MRTMYNKRFQILIKKKQIRFVNVIRKRRWNPEIFEKQYFSGNSILADITSEYQKKVENDRPISGLPSVSKYFERIIQKKFSSYIDELLGPHL